MDEFDQRPVGCDSLCCAFAVGVALCLLPGELVETVPFEIALGCLEVAGGYDDGLGGEGAEGCAVEGVADDEVGLGEESGQVELRLEKVSVILKGVNGFVLTSAAAFLNSIAS